MRCDAQRVQLPTIDLMQPTLVDFRTRPRRGWGDDQGHLPRPHRGSGFYARSRDWEVESAGDRDVRRNFGGHALELAATKIVEK